MRFRVIQRILGLLLTVSSVSMLMPAVIALWSDDGAFRAFTLAFWITLLAGLVIWLPVRHKRYELRLRDGFLIVVLFWAVLGISGAIPFALIEEPRMSFSDAIFESMSGLTTTGATVLVGLDNMPVSILFYRQQLQWMGGMGIIVLAVAILPMLGVGGMQLYRAETPGPMKDAKLTPRITETAKALWYIYLSMTIACAAAYRAAGMSGFDAICHGFSTVAIGGFSTHDLSIAYFNSPVIEAIAIVFMLAAGVNFSLHFLAFRSRSLRPYSTDAEFKAYAFILFVVCAASTLTLLFTETYTDLDYAARQGIFQAVSIGTTTGFTTTNFQAWPGFLPVLLIFSSFIGGCAGSTGGGLKVLRVLLLIKQGLREIKRLVHPNAIFPIKIGGRPLPYRVVDAVWGFFATYVAVFTLMLLALMATGMDQVTAFSAVAASLNNLGPGLGDVSAHYGNVTDPAKWILSFAMLLGRLEIFTLLVLFTPTFWRS